METVKATRAAMSIIPLTPMATVMGVVNAV